MNLERLEALLTRHLHGSLETDPLNDKLPHVTQIERVFGESDVCELEALRLAEKLDHSVKGQPPVAVAPD